MCCHQLPRAANQKKEPVPTSCAVNYALGIDGKIMRGLGLVHSGFVELVLGGNENEIIMVWNLAGDLR